MQTALQPAAATVPPKNTSKAPARPARRFKDWDDEENNEKSVNRKGLVGPEDIIAGSNYKFLNWDDPKWADPATGVRYRVSNFYPGAKLIIDYPPSEKFVASKKAFFESIGQLYLCILPGEPMDQDAALAELERQAAVFETKEAAIHVATAAIPPATPARADQGPPPSRRRPATVAKAKPKGKRHVNAKR